jgi:hypothetical protein
MKLGLAVVLACTLATPALAARADGFAAFWPNFAAAVARDDARALATMVALGPGLGDNGGSFARFHAANLGSEARRCLAKVKPARDVGPHGAVSYSAFCGEVIYVFSKVDGVWKLTDLGAND